MTEQFANIGLSLITPSLTNPRKHFNATKLQELASLRNSGLVYALLKADMQKGLVVLEGGMYRRALA